MLKKAHVLISKSCSPLEVLLKKKQLYRWNVTRTKSDWERWSLTLLNYPSRLRFSLQKCIFNCHNWCQVPRLSSFSPFVALVTSSFNLCKCSTGSKLTKSCSGTNWKLLLVFIQPFLTPLNFWCYDLSLAASFNWAHYRHSELMKEAREEEGVPLN